MSLEQWAEVRRAAGCPHETPPDVVVRRRNGARQATLECRDCGVQFDPRKARTA